MVAAGVTANCKGRCCPKENDAPASWNEKLTIRDYSAIAVRESKTLVRTKHLQGPDKNQTSNQFTVGPRFCTHVRPTESLMPQALWM